MILKIRDADGNVQEVLVIKGEGYMLTNADKAEIASKIGTTESWVFTLENGSTVTKTVVVK